MQSEIKICRLAALITGSIYLSQLVFAIIFAFTAVSLALLPPILGYGMPKETFQAAGNN